jgi:hypothetical protein
MSRLDWETEVRPVLVAAYRALDKAGSVFPNVESGHINTELCRTPDDARHSLALEYLNEARYVKGDRAMGSVWSDVTLLEKGLVEVAGWPAQPGEDYGAKLLDVLDVRITDAEDEDERTRLKRFRDAVASVGKDVVTGVLTDLARRGI